MTTPITTSITDSQMHNNIMAAGLRDRPPMLATGRYAQWQSRPYQPTTVTILAVPATENSPAVPERTTVETILTMSLENKAHYESEKEAIHLLLTGIGDEIYSTVDACETAHEIWIAIKRLQQEWSKFVTIVKQQHELDKVSYYKLFDILKQYQNEVIEIRAERIAKNENPLALVAAAQQYPDPYYQAPKSHKLFAPPSKQASPTRSNASTKFKGKEIAKPIIPPSKSAFEEDNDPEQAQRDKDMHKNLALIAKYFKKIYKPTNNNLRTSSNSRNKNVDTTLRETETKKSERLNVSQGKMLLCKQAKKGVPLQAEQADWLEDTNEEIDEQELEAHYSFMEKIQEDDSNVTPDSPDMCDNDIHTDQNADNERVALANLIANLKLDDDENKKIQKQLKKANASLAQEMKECEYILAKTSKTLGESNSIRDSCIVALQNKQTKFERYKAFNDRAVDYDKLKRKLNETLGLLAQKEIDIKEGLKVKAYEILVSKEKHDELVKMSLLTKSHFEGLVKEKTKVITDLKLKEEKDIDKMISMEKQLKFLNEIIYKRNQ
ncbi:hypothetical protein Tco_0739265 [Tanacetum coccineum]